MKNNTTDSTLLNEIKNIIYENISLEDYNIRNGIKQFKITEIGGVTVDADCLLLISLNKRNPLQILAKANAQSAGLENPSHFGEIEILKCQKKKSLFGESLKVVKNYKKVFSKDMWEDENEKIVLHDCIK